MYSNTYGYLNVDTLRMYIYMQLFLHRIYTDLSQTFFYHI
jgi:hypothetical protein